MLNRKGFGASFFFYDKFYTCLAYVCSCLIEVNTVLDVIV